LNLNPFAKKIDGNADVVALTGDFHFNGKTAVCPPSFTDDENGTYRANEAQLFLWDCWLDYCQEVSNLKKKLKGKLYFICNGDLVDGDHHNTFQIITRNPADQHKLAVAGLEPMLSLNPDYIFFVRGTWVHVGGQACWEELIGKDLGAVQDKNENYSWWWLPIEINGVSMDIAHHGRVGQLPWTFPNTVNRLAIETVLRYTDQGKEPPDLVIRSHRHIAVDTGDNFSVRAIQLPAWQLPTEYIHYIKPGEFPKVGGIIALCQNGHYEIIKKSYQPEMDEAWTESIHNPK
jgi:hypothetical protein